MRLYATTQEFLDHPTGINVDNLVTGGTQTAQTDELNLLLQGASNALDVWCFHPLYAHTTTETTRSGPNSDGTLPVRLKDWPIASITSAQWRQTAANSWQTININQVELYPDLSDGHEYIAADADYGLIYGWGQPSFTVQTTYVAGYPNMVLTANALQGATSLTVDNTLGVNPGDTVKIYDGTNYEEVVVSSTVTIGTTTLPLETGTLYAHNTGIRVSEVPDAITLSAILYAGYLIKERRAGSATTMRGSIQPLNVINSEDMQLVRQFLQPFRRVI